MSIMAGLPDSVGTLFADLPGFLGTVQIIAYIGFILFFGSIAIIGFRAYVHWSVRLLIRIATGFIALIAGIAINPYMPFFKGGFYQLMQLDIIASGLIASVIIGICLYLMTFGMINVVSIEKRISSLSRKLEKVKSKPAAAAKPIKIVGIVILAIFLVFSVMNFRGFPSMNDQISSFIGSSLGVNPSGFSDILSGGLSEECVQAASLLTSHQDDLSSLLIPYQDSSLQQALESKSNSSLSQMMRAELEGTPVVIGIMSNGDSCFATETEACVCMGMG